MFAPLWAEQRSSGVLSRSFQMSGWKSCDSLPTTRCSLQFWLYWAAFVIDVAAVWLRTGCSTLNEVRLFYSLELEWLISEILSVLVSLLHSLHQSVFFSIGFALSFRFLWICLIPISTWHALQFDRALILNWPQILPRSILYADADFDSVFEGSSWFSCLSWQRNCFETSR